MIEAGANEVPNELMLEAIKTAHEEIKKVCKFISDIQKEIGKPKFEYKSFEVDHDIYEFIEENFKEEMKEKVQEEDKETRDNNIDQLTAKQKKLTQKNLEKKHMKNTKQTLEKLYTNQKKNV